MDVNTWQINLTAFGAIATPLIVLILGGIGWKYKSRITREIDNEDKLRDDRISTYNIILEPFTLLLMTNEAWEYDKRNIGKNRNEMALNLLMSHEYRKAAFKLSLVANDDVVRSYNGLMQYLYNSTENLNGKSKEKDLKAKIELLGMLLLEIRKSMGNGSTKISHWEMLEWLIKDVREIKNA